MFNYCAILGVWFPGCPLFRGNFVLESAVGSVVWWPRAFRDSNSYFRRPISDFRSPFSDVRSPTSDLRSPISVIDILFGNYRTKFVTPVYIL